MNKEKAMAILHWIIFDSTPMSEEDRDMLGKLLIFLVEQVEPIYDKYTKESTDDNNQTGTKSEQ